jgi:hypothetical protein
VDNLDVDKLLDSGRPMLPDGAGTPDCVAMLLMIATTIS